MHVLNIVIKCICSVILLFTLVTKNVMFLYQKDLKM
jgi:hypothetical protein